MRSPTRSRRLRTLAPLAAAALLLVACGGDDAEESPDAQTGDPEAAEVPEGPEIVVSSFNFPESTILAEIYGQAMEDAGYPIGRELDLGARDLTMQAFDSGDIDFLPEYLGSALVTGFGEEPPEDVESGVEALTAAFEVEGISVLEPAPAVNSNAFVTTAAFAEENGLSTIGDLADVEGGITFAGPPECETRDTCLLGLTEGYGLDVTFESIQEASARLAALEAGDVDLILLFSTDAPLAGDQLLQLEDTEGIVPPENIVPVLRTEAVDAYGDDLVGLINDISGMLTTEVLVELNQQSSEGLAPDQIASDWLAEQGVTG